MTVLYPIVLETEETGAVSAYVPGLPVYAAAETHAKAERAIRTVLSAYLEAHPASRPDARVRVARVSTAAPTRVDIVGPAALVGAHRSTAKARASQRTAGLGVDLARRRPRDDGARSKQVSLPFRPGAEASPPPEARSPFGANSRK